MRSLVLGGCGFIGSHIVDELLARNHRVTIFDRRPEKFRAAIPTVDYVFADFSDRSTLIEALSQIDVVFHSISTTFPATAEIDPIADIESNLLNSLRLFDLMIQVGISRIVYLSSGGTVYGIPDIIPVPEKHPLRPINSYGVVKVAIENYLEVFFREGKISPVIIRPSNPYGPRQAHLGIQGVVATFMKRALEGMPIEIWGDGTVIRDYLHVTDLARLAVVAAFSEKVGPINAGSGEGLSINEMIEMISLATGVKLEKIYKPGRSVDIAQSVLDVSRAREWFNWSAKIGIERGLRSYCEWMRSQGTSDFARLN